MEIKDERLTIRITKTLRKNLKAYCREHDRKEGQVAEIALKELLGMRRRTRLAAAR